MHIFQGILPSVSLQGETKNYRYLFKNRRLNDMVGALAWHPKVTVDSC